eukprot:jgi/Tetstr1/449394/TSEL_036489.t1
MRMRGPRQSHRWFATASSSGLLADYNSEAVAKLSDELLRREAEYNVTAAAKAAVQQRFEVGPYPNEDGNDDDEPPSRARRRRPSGRRPRPDFRPTADDADKAKA